MGSGLGQIEFTVGEELSHDKLNRLAETGRRGEGIPGGAGSDAASFSGGTVYARRPPQEFWIKLTGGGTGGVYAWTEQVPDSSGTWVDGTRAGTTTEDPAVEVNATGTLATDGTVRAFAWRLPGSNRLNFQMGVCA